MSPLNQTLIALISFSFNHAFALCRNTRDVCFNKSVFIWTFCQLLTEKPNCMKNVIGQAWWNKESEILNSHLKCFSLEKHIGVRRKEDTVNHATSYEILCEK